MLIDFTVENFRSIKDPVTLSMVAAPGKKTSAKSTTRRKVKPDDEIAPPFRDEARNLSLLPVVGIFGANASGKSNILDAFSSFILFIKRGADSQGNNLTWFSPFELDSSTRKLPIRFTLRIIQEGTLFTYTLSLIRARILEEILEYVPREASKMRNRLLFKRTWHEDEKAYVFTNGKDFGNVYKEIQESLREHEPFASILATRINVEIVKPFLSWLREVMGAFPVGSEKAEYEWAAWALQSEDDSLLEEVTKIIQQFDTGISGIKIEAVESEPGEEGKQFKVWALHNTNSGQIRWLMERESTGTQRLFSLACSILLAFYDGGLLSIDELGSNIHPNITRAIIRMFQSAKTNPKRAQLIFTSHDNTLQRGNLLRRDQIWFTQKRADGSTELYPLSDFKPRNDLAIDRAYLEGRFGAVPILPDEEELLEPAEAK